MILWMCQSRGRKCVVQHQQLLFGLLPVLMCLSTLKTQNGLPARLWSLLLSMPCRSESNVWHAELQAVWFNSVKLMVNFVWMAMCICYMSLSGAYWILEPNSAIRERCTCSGYTMSTAEPRPMCCTRLIAGRFNRSNTPSVFQSNTNKRGFPQEKVPLFHRKLRNVSSCAAERLFCPCILRPVKLVKNIWQSFFFAFFFAHYAKHNTVHLHINMVAAARSVLVFLSLVLCV